MLIAPLPDDEAARILSLRRYQVLDTPAEAAFDRLTELAAHLLGVPVALVSLVDAQRQWFKSRIGLEACETARDISFCGHAVHARSLLIVPDATQDPRFADNPLVTGSPHVRFYAGAPLIGRDGHALGTLCVIDQQPRATPSAEQLRMLRLLADAVVDALELRLHARRQDDKAALSQLCSAAAAQAHGARNLQDGLPAVLDALCRYAGASQGQAWLVDATTHPASGNGLCGWPMPKPGRSIDAPEAELLNRALATSQPLLLRASPSTPGSQDTLCLAVRMGGRVQALMACAASPLQRNDDDLLAAAGFVAAQLGSLAERAHAVALQDEFVATVSHELRTPLTSIAGMLALLEMGKAGPLAPKAQQMIAVAHRNSQRLTRLVNDILDMGKLQAGALELQASTQPLAPLVDRAMTEIGSLADLRGVRLVFSNTAGTALACVDADRLIQVVTNLLSNAVKFSPDGGTVRLTLAQTEAGLRLSVADEGPGIPEEFQPRLFSRFAQAASRHQPQQGGSGLGLAIVKNLVQAMGGRVGFQTAAGRGTVFQVDLPQALS